MLSNNIAKSRQAGKTKIFATGATGLVGSRFVEMFADDYEVINLDLTTGVDITRADTLHSALNKHSDAAAIIHLAAFTDTNKAMEQKGDKNGACYQVNVEGTRNVAAAARARNLHLIHVSTDFVFDGTKNTPYTEDDQPSPIEWYGETKAIAEQVVRDSGASYAIVRISYPYRANYQAKPDLVKKIRAGLESGKLYPQFTDTTITPTWIDDIARTFDALIRRKKTGIYHASGSTSLSPYEFACAVAEAYGFDPNVVKQGSLTEYLVTATRPYARHVAMSNNKASNELGLKFADLATGLAEIKKQQGS